LGVKLTLPVRRTWAPRGKTPVLRHRYRRGKQLSMCGLVADRPGPGDRDEPATWMGFDLLEGADDTRQCVRVLDGLGSQLGHQPTTVIWDNLGAHHAGALQAWAATQPWLVFAYLPSDAPELDPVEGLWDARMGRQVAWRAAKSARMAWSTSRAR
jgi:DDE superfamily endonuclease